MTEIDNHWETNQCCCPACMGALAEEWEDTENSLDPSATVGDGTPNQYDKPVWSAYLTAQHLARQGSTWADDGKTVGGKTEVSYRFYDETTAGNPDHEFEDINKVNTRKILDQFAEVGDIVFTEQTDQSGGANINFKYRDGQNGGGYWNGSDVVVSRVGWEPEMEAGTYNQSLMIHEIGHAMGLNHPGNYNGGGSNYADDALYWNDSQQYTNMSYWSESNTDASFGNMSTLGLHDILAIQIEYGVNTSTRTGDDTYGFNATAGDAYDFESTRTNGSGRERSNTDMAFSIWDADGDDTLDLSGSNKAVDLDLREGAFSSTNGKIYNVSVAYGAVVENGVGSDHNDALRGNAVNNVLWGGLGNDTLIGGAEDAGPASNPRAFTGISLNDDPNQFSQRLQADDMSALSGGAFTIDMMVDVTRMSANETTFVSYATQGNADTFLVQGRSDNMLRIEINGATIDTDIKTLSLIDGQAHRLSIGWDGPTGALRVHIDGDLAWSGTHQAGATIASGGTLVFGQDQDNVGGGFNIRQTFQGTIGDIRIFDEQRTDQAIAQDAFADPVGNTPVHHWSVAPKATGAISDSGAGGWVNLIAANPANVTATQSSQYSNYDASRVLDGNENTFSHTRNGASESLSVRFDNAVNAEFIEIINRSNYSSRLEGAQVEIYDANGALIERYAPIEDTGWRSAHGFSVPIGRLVSEVRVVSENEYLHVSEIRVFGGQGAVENLAILNGATVETVGVVTAQTDADTLYGGAGTDTLYGGFGADQLNGEADQDMLYGGRGHDDLRGGASADTLYGDAGNDVLDGGAASDEIYGGAGNDRFILSAGRDQNYGGSGQNTISGGADGTLLTVGTVFDLEQGVQSLRGVDGSRWQDFIDYENANLKDVSGAGETVRGSSADNMIATGSNDNVLFGQDGDDTLDGAGGDDMLYGGAGDDRVFSGRGADEVHLGTGDDYVRVGGGVEKFYGGEGKDYISYYDSAKGVTLHLADGTASGSWASNDTIDGFESASGSRTGADKIYGTSGSNTIKTYGGNDKVYGGRGNDKVELGSGDDYVRVGGGTEKFDGGSGQDYISYYDSAAGIRIDLREDEISGSWGVNDTIKDFEGASGSGTGADLMLGTNGDNKLRGYGGDDRLYGRNGSDKLYGGSGDDFLDGGAGSETDFLYGGSGSDEFHFDRGEGIDVVKDFENNIDTIALDNFSFGSKDAFDYAQKVGSDVVFDFGRDGVLTIENTTIAQLQNDLVLV